MELSCGLICTPAIGLMMVFDSPTNYNLYENAYHGNPWYYGYSLAVVGITIVATLVSIVANIAMLMMKDWGRRLVVAYCVFSVAMAIIGILASLGFDGIALADPGSSAQVKSEILRNMVIGIGVSAVMGLVYPLIQVYCLTRASVIEDFAIAASGLPAPGEGAEAAAYRVNYPPPPAGYPPQGPPPSMPPPPPGQ